MKIVPLADIKARLSEYLDESATQGPVIITRNGKAVAVIITARDDEDLENLILARSPRFQEMLSESRKSLKEGKGLSSEVFWKMMENR